MQSAVAHIYLRPLTPRERALARALARLAAALPLASDAFYRIGMAAAGATLAAQDLTESYRNSLPKNREGGSDV